MSLRAKFLVNNNLSNTQSNNYGFRLRKDAWNILWYFCHFWSLFIWKTAIWTSLCLSQKSNVFGTAWWWVNEDRIWNSVNYKKKKKKLSGVFVFTLSNVLPRLVAAVGCQWPLAGRWKAEARWGVCVSVCPTHSHLCLYHPHQMQDTVDTQCSSLPLSYREQNRGWV